MLRKTPGPLAILLLLGALASACGDKHVIDDPATSTLPRPGLERPPVSGLPADLRPPR